MEKNDRKTVSAIATDRSGKHKKTKGGEKVKHYKATEHSLVHNAYAFLWACGYVYGKEIVKGLDWFGRKLVGLIDHSDFFAGVIWTYVVMTAWDLLTR